MRYEMAAKYRDLRKTVIKLSEQQKMATTSARDVDIFAYYREGRLLALQLFTMREGHIVGRREFFWEDLPEDDFDPAPFLGEVLAQYYATDYVPKEIHVPVDFEDRELLEKALTARKGRRVKIHCSQRGEKRDLIDLGEKNAKLAFEQRFPARIESFDISHIQGAENVAGMVVCDNGKMNRAEYRKFRIKTVEGAND